MLSHDCEIIAVCKRPDGGSTVQYATGDDVRRFCADIMGSIFDGCWERYHFALGFAAAVDALAGGRIDFARANLTAELAWSDVNETGGREPYVTDLVQAYCDSLRLGAVSDGR